MRMFPGLEALERASRFWSNLRRTAENLSAVADDGFDPHFIDVREGVSEMRSRVHIPGSALFYWNPAANKEKASELAAELSAAMKGMVGSGELSIGGKYSFHSTMEDTEARIDHIVAQAGRLLDDNPRQRIAVAAFGGDRTADDVAYAVARIRSERSYDAYVPNVVAVAYPGGTANDVRAITGAPSVWRIRRESIQSLARFLSGNTVAELPLVRFDLKAPGGRRFQWHSVYGFTAPNSGVFFRDVEEIKRVRKARGESVTVANDYLPKLPRVAWEARRAVYTRVAVNGEVMNGGKPFKTGEFFLTIPGQFGGVTKMPVTEMGARAYVAYKFPWGVAPLLETFGRKILADLGFQHFINLGGRVYPLSRDRQIDLMFGDMMEVDFLNRDGSPREVLGTLAGDAVGPVTGFEARIACYVPFLCNPNSDIMVLQGKVKPSMPSVMRSGIQFMRGALRRWV